MNKAFKLPFFGFTLGFTIFYISLLIFLPLSVLFLNVANLSFAEMLDVIRNPRVTSAFKLTFSSALIAAFFDSIIGLLIAWCIVRYNFWGKKIIDGLIDIPFALPTAIAGIALASIFSQHGIIGKSLNQIGINVIYSQSGIIIALMFVGLPFAVRAVEPVLQDLDQDTENAALCLGASKLQVFTKIIFPTIFPSILSGFALTFARGLGEYGSIIFIAGNIPKKTETLPLLLFIKVEQFNFDHASLIACVSLIASFVLLYMVNFLQKWGNRYNSE